MVNNWIERHRDPRSFMLHLLGIPCTILGVLLLPIYVMQMSGPIFLFALGLFLGGFALQFLGHGLEGTEPGEIKALRHCLAVRREARKARAGVRVTFPEVDHA